MRALWVVLALLVGALVGGWRGVQYTENTQSAALLQRDSLLAAEGARLDSVQARLAQAEDSLRARYKTDTVRLRTTRTVVESLPHRLDQYLDSVGVPVESVRVWVAAAVDHSRSCSTAVTTCEARVVNLTAQRDTAQAQRNTAQARVVVRDSLRVQDSLALHRAREQTHRERVLKWGALALAALAAVFR